jgi:ribosomal-protein-alanine N-acetyltransferase
MAEGRRTRVTGDSLERGERTFLREPLRSDQEEFLELRRASRELHEPWEPEAPPGFDPYGSEAFRSYLDFGRDGRKQRLLLCRNEDAAILGSFSLSEIVRGILQSGCLGYWVGAPFARQGYMSEGLRLVQRHVFQRLDLHRLEANIQPANEPSRRLVQRCGFRLEGFSPRYIKLHGRWCDHERWAITAEEWKR